MNPGRELDALVAERVMGWKPRLCSRCKGNKTDPLGAHYGACCTCSGSGIEPHNLYSTDIAAAWEVVEKLREKHFYFELSCHHGLWQIKIDHHNEGDDLAHSVTSASHAICLAALKAVGVDVERD